MIFERRKFLIISMLLVSGLSLSACGEKSDNGGKQPAENPPALTDLSGEWKTETDEDGGCMGAYIEGEYIEVYWVMPSEDTVSLYWSGSFTAPSAGDDEYSWTSQADSERNSSALLASPDETKEFTYEDQEISCSVSLMGTTKKMTFTKGEWGYSKLPKEEHSGGSGGAKMEGSGDLGDYHVEIKGASIEKDDDGNPAIVVTYAWTNNSEDTTMASDTVYPKAFQDGVQLDSTWVDSKEYDIWADAKEVRPGATIDLQAMFELTSETSTVEFEISEFFDSGDIVTMNFEPEELS